MAIALFYISLVLIIGFFAIKFFEIYFDRKHIVSKVICQGDEYCNEAVVKTRHTISKIKFKNFQKLAIIIGTWLKQEAIYLKRRFDSKQPKFFLKPSNKPDLHKKGSVSFFLKNVSDYKESLKKKDL
jgi:hypothetical protein